jgi:hypothetical protein
LLLAALEAEGYGRSVEDVLAKVRAGQCFVWTGPDALMVTEWHDRPDGRALHVWLGAGDIGALIAMAPGMMAWARDQGAIEATIEGRPGWARALRALGFALRSVTVGVKL